MLDVLGMGVLLTGDSGVGKSELALELITRGSGLVADDVAELYHIAPQTLEARCPEMLKDFLEVRGLGMLNIRTIFGETAVRIRKNLKLIVQLERPVQGQVPGLERLPLHATTEEIMGVAIRKVQLPVAARKEPRGARRGRRPELRSAVARHRQHPGLHPSPGAASGRRRRLRVRPVRSRKDDPDGDWTRRPCRIGERLSGPTCQQVRRMHPEYDYGHFGNPAAR